MFRRMKSVIKSFKIRLKLYFSSPKTQWKIYVKYYGVKIGKNSRFTGKHISFGSEPYLVTIGDNVTITADVIFETHDGGVGIFRDEYPGINLFGKIHIGNNVFLGHRSIIMPGVTIGNNVVIGAGSIVTKNIPDNSIAVGVPARVLKTTDEYKQKILNKAIYINETDPLKRKKEILSKLDI